MLLVSGLNVGFRRTVPHVIGISSGFGVMVAVVGAGLGSVFITYPLIYEILRWVSAAYLLYLAWKIGSSGPTAVDGQGAAEYRPFGFWRAAAFQWVNPKAWVMAIAAIVTYAPISASSSTLRAVTTVVLVAAIFALINLPSVGVWAFFGSVLQRFLHRPQWVRAVNVTMALLLVASLYPLVVE
ncbi:MAG: LysE family translocator [Streptomycetaceae bacterium]|nr:LysE family translocator [Streptomycetaceae bacterium]